MIGWSECKFQVSNNTGINIPSKEAQFHHITCFPKLFQLTFFKHYDNSLEREGHSEFERIIFWWQFMQISGEITQLNPPLITEEMVHIRPTRNFDLDISSICSKLQGLMDSYTLLHKNIRVPMEFLCKLFFWIYFTTQKVYLTLLMLITEPSVQSWMEYLGLFFFL